MADDRKDGYEMQVTKQNNRRRKRRRKEETMMLPDASSVPVGTSVLDNHPIHHLHLESV